MSHRSISLNSDLVEEISQYIEGDKKYRSIAAFLEESARLRIQALKSCKVEA